MPLTPLPLSRWSRRLLAGVAGSVAAGCLALTVQVAPAGPRTWSGDFHSAALDRDMRFMVMLPADMRAGERVPVIYLLHGRGRDETTLLADEFCRRQLRGSRCAIVLPRGEDGWYLDSPVVPGDRYAGYLDEVISAAEEHFPLRRDGGGRALAGWSMGGYGAAYTFVRRPGDFAALATIIGIVDYPRTEMEPRDQNYPVQPRFGADPAAWRGFNPRLGLAGVAPRPLLVAYADRAAERQMNEAFIAEAKGRGFPVRELRIPGEHVFAVVREALPAVLAFLELQLLPPPATPAPSHLR
jgi:S-formylglutathione hydrolase FrmB